MGDDLKLLGSRIKDQREFLGLTQEELAKSVGTTKSMISSYEAGRTDPRQSIIVRIAERLGVSANWLLGFDDIAENRNNRELRVLFDRFRNASPESIDKLERLVDAVFDEDELNP